MKLGISCAAASASYLADRAATRPRAVSFTDAVAYPAAVEETARAVGIVLGLLADSAAVQVRTLRALDALALRWGRP